uniref:Uncharacterized protein n=1 Tax=Nelumbo nucifera TaxID=4432 RepID=A0A822XT13_NELNU|nr:TPA_asm: hypothetical protein HUJ06_023692 [Nelumbo nucifera]
MKLRRRVVATGFKTFEFETKLTESERSRRAWMRVTGRGELNCKVSPRDEKESRKAPAGKSRVVVSGGFAHISIVYQTGPVRFLETFVCIKTEDLGLGIPEEEKSSGWAIFQEALTILDLDLSTTSAGGEEQSGGIWKLRPHFYSPSNWSVVRFLETFVCIKTEDLGLGIPEEEKKLRLGNLPGGLNRS